MSVQSTAKLKQNSVRATSLVFLLCEWKGGSITPPHSTSQFVSYQNLGHYNQRHWKMRALAPAKSHLTPLLIHLKRQEQERGGGCRVLEEALTIPNDSSNALTSFRTLKHLCNCLALPLTMHSSLHSSHRVVLTASTVEDSCPKHCSL